VEGGSSWPRRVGTGRRPRVGAGAGMATAGAVTVFPSLVAFADQSAVRARTCPPPRSPSATTGQFDAGLQSGGPMGTDESVTGGVVTGELALVFGPGAGDGEVETGGVAVRVGQMGNTLWLLGSSRFCSW